MFTKLVSSLYFVAHSKPAIVSFVSNHGYQHAPFKTTMMMSTRALPTRYFNQDYLENVVLRDDMKVHLRLMRPSDRDLWLDFFNGLSAESHFMRFCSPKRKASEKEIQYFVNVDQEKHFAIVATAGPNAATEEIGCCEQGKERFVGIARFIALDKSTIESPTAELAITISDEVQGHGLGFLLTLRLVAAALERGIGGFEAYAHATNRRIIRLLKHIAPDCVVKRFGTDVEVFARLPLIDPKECWEHMNEREQDVKLSK